MAARNNAIDFIRTISVLYITGYWHLFNYIHGFHHSNPYTSSMVRVVLGSFVFTSGYLIAGRPLNLRFSEVLSFYRRRIVRIYPLYALALLLFYLASSSRKIPSTTIHAALLLSMFVPPAMPTLWFISMIMNFYFVAPLLMRFATRPVIFLIVCTAIFTSLLCFSNFMHPIDLRILVYLPTFAFGILLARNSSIHQGLHKWRLVLVLLIIPAFIISRSGNYKSLLGIAEFIPSIVIGALALFIYSEVYIGKLQNRYLSSVILFLSYSSFCTYLFHRVVYKYVKAFYFPHGLYLQIAYMLVVGLGTTIIMSFLIQKTYDTLLAIVSRRINRIKVD